MNKTIPHITHQHYWAASAQLTGNVKPHDICNKAIEIALAEQAQEQYITAADITPAMHKKWNEIFGADDMSVASPKDGAIMAAAYNAVIKHRSEAG